MTKEKRSKMLMNRGGPDSGRFDVEIGKTYVVVEPDRRFAVTAVAIKGSDGSPYVEVETEGGPALRKKLVFGARNVIRGRTCRHRGPYLAEYDPAVEARLAGEAVYKARLLELANRAHELFPYYVKWLEALDGSDHEGNRIVEELCDHFEARQDAEWWASFCGAWGDIGVLYANRWPDKQNPRFTLR